MTEFTDITYEVDNGLAWITINRPDRYNAFRAQTVDELILAFKRAWVSSDVGVIALTGAGDKAFCAGGDLKGMRDKTGITKAETGAEIRESYRRGIQMIPLALYEMDVPTIAAINGPAIGAGLDLACMCDIRIAADTAVMAESYVKLGIIPGGGGAWLLPRAIGMARASQMTLTGDAIDAAKALEYGLVSEVVPGDDLLTRAREIADSIAANPVHATRMAKRLLREGQHMQLGPLLEMAAAYQALSHHTEDHHEAIEAFLDKREPHFTGR